ncbi:DNA polymerase III subunit beta [Streptomyces sp. LHD-70]|uniref:DNA polymerase III subunit beta n=1 Tax=Streptomyces sp. LHD-70 TaxID=3072140 RepID=UPI00280DF8E6|nr:DNA polymerase III subunit beta [Streptomyces sp. LHD-70]MDQ8707485.1 DNA polymerase III subunit beta [Streptomyces sp. LHD-70]
MTQVIPEQNANPNTAQLNAQFTTNHTELTAALKAMEMAVPARPPHPLLGCVLLRSHEQGATLSGFDYEVAVTVELPAQSTAPGASLLHYSELAKSLKAVATGETKATAARMPVTLTGDMLSTPELALPMASEDVTEYPTPFPPVPATMNVDAAALLAQLTRVLPAAGTDDTLPTLTGVQFTITQHLELASTDRYRFAVAQLPVTHHGSHPDNPVTANIHGGTLKALCSHLKTTSGPVRIGVANDAHDHRVTFILDTITITTRTLEGELPKYAKLFPDTYAATLGVDRAALLRAVRKVKALMGAKNQRNSPAVLRLDDTGDATLCPSLYEGHDQDRVKGMQVTIKPAAGSTEPGTVALNPDFLTDGLNTLTTDTVYLHLPHMTDGRVVKPLLLTEGPDATDTDYRYLLMPVRL